MKRLLDFLFKEEARQAAEPADLESHSVVVFYSSSFGSRGGSGSSFGSPGGFGSSGNSMSPYGIGPGSPSRPDPIGPLGGGINIQDEPMVIEPPKVDINLSRPIDTGMDYGRMLEQNKALQGILQDMPSVPSRFGAPEIPAYTPRLSDAVNRGMPSVPSRFGGAGSEKFGLTNPQDFHTGYDMPNLKIQLHLHGPDKNTITHGHIVSYGHKPNEKPLVELNGFKASLASLGAEKIGLKKFK